jgi:hypothetical protein
MELSDLHAKIESFESQINVHMAAAVQDNAEKIAQLNVDQMLDGKTGDGSPIRPEYSPSYEKFKGFATPNLKLTGEFHRETTTLVPDDNYQIVSLDFKEQYLVDRYGEEIHVLTDQSKQKAQVFCTDSFAKRFIKHTGL